MAARPVTVSTELQLRLVVPGATSLPVRAGMRYDVTDPYAVSVAFHTGGTDGTDGAEDVVEWTFARQLLTDGVSGPVGEGDVQVWPTTGTPPTGDQDGGVGAIVCLSLSSPSGRALFEVPLPELVEFLGQTYEAVPTGAEGAHVDVDAELALLLWAEPET